MKIFYITPYTPNKIRVRPYNLIRNLAKRDHQVSVYTLFTNEIEQHEIASLRGCCEIEAFRISNRESIVNSLKALPTREPLQSVYSWQPKLAEKIVVDLIEKKPDVIHVEHLRGARYGMYVRLKSHQHMSTVPLIWDSVDCISDLFTQAVKRNSGLKHKLLLWFELPRTRYFESKAVDLFNHILVTSPKDAQALNGLRKNGLGDYPIYVLPNGVDLEVFYPEDGAVRKKDTLIVSGKMSYHANIAMTQYLVREIMPRVWEKRPGIKLWIVGKDPAREIQLFSDNPLIQVTGMVDDISDYLRRATIAVAPLRYGAGIQNKILEAMACSTPVITNSRAMGSLSAIDGKDLIVANDASEFVQSIIDLLDDDAKRQEIGQSGRRYVETNHSWKKIATQLEMVYQAAIEAAMTDVKIEKQGNHYGNR